MMPGWLMTGGSGFLGRHVLDALAEADYRVLGRRCPAGCPIDRFLQADLTDPESLVAAINAAGPDRVIHAAGRTPPASASSLYEANTLATLHLLDALKSIGKPVRIVLAGSAAELGPVEVEALPVGEDYPCRPVDAYGLSKWLSTCAGLAARAPLEVMAARVFNPIGPGQPLNQAFGRFASRLAGQKPETLVVGNLETRRDFVDVRDVARALIALADTGKPGLVYNVGTGHSHRIGDGLDHLIRRHGQVVKVQVDPALSPSSGPKDSRADIRRIVAHTDWRPERSFEESLDALWDEVISPPGESA